MPSVMAVIRRNRICPSQVNGLPHQLVPSNLEAAQVSPKIG